MIVRRYGRGPLHLLGHLALLALTAYAVAAIFDVLNAAPWVMVWLVAAVLLHDALLWPLYTALDRGLQRGLGAAVNYVRVPAGLSALLALVFVGTLFGFGEDTYANASGARWDGYALRWLVVTAALFAASGIAFALRRAR